MPGTGSAAVVFIGVNLEEAGADLADDISHAILLDVHVEGVEHDLTGGMVDTVDQFNGLVGGADEAGLEPIERLEPQAHSALSRVFRKIPKDIDQDLHIVFAVFGTLLPCAADGGIERSDEVLTPDD